MLSLAARVLVLPEGSETMGIDFLTQGKKERKKMVLEWFKLTILWCGHQCPSELDYMTTAVLLP